MKTHELAQQLGVTNQTIGNWIKRFETFFSDGAKAINTRLRSYEENDLIILATIAKLSHEGLNYETIHQRLTDGERVENLGTVQFGVDGALIARSTADSWVDAAGIRTELELLQGERDRLLSLLDTERQEHKQQLTDRDQKIDQLHREIAELRERVGRAEAEAELRRRRWFG